MLSGLLTLVSFLSESTAMMMFAMQANVLTPSTRPLTSRKFGAICNN